MAGGYDYALTDFSTQADNQTVSSTSRRSNESSEEIPPQNPFVGQTENVAHSLPAQPYDPGSGNYLLSNEHQQHQAYSHAFFREWAVEWTAWLLAALSLVALISLFLIYSGVPLRRWEAAITPATAVAILSQLGQTSILVPVTACVCQSMWLWLSKESQATTHGGRSSLIMMQKYDESRRGPISSIILLWKHPTAYAPLVSPLRETDKQQVTCLARDCEYSFDYYLWSFRAAVAAASYPGT